MRARLAAVALLLALPGCLGPDYYLSAVSATYGFEGEAWDAARAGAGMREANLSALPGDFSAVRAGAPGVEARAARLENGTIEVTFTFAVSEHTGTRERALERAQEVRSAKASEADALVAAFERGSGWTRSRGPEWRDAILHGD